MFYKPGKNISGFTNIESSSRNFLENMEERVDNNAIQNNKIVYYVRHADDILTTQACNKNIIMKETVVNKYNSQHEAPQFPITEENMNEITPLV
jgi:hypothetical protein